MINISELIGDPDFTQPNGVTVIRRKMEIKNHVPVITESKMNVTGIITIAQDIELNMENTGDTNKEAIHVFTYKQLFTTGRMDESSDSDYMSDIIVWQGNRYKVMDCKDDEQYGFCQSTAVKLSRVVM